MTSKADKLPLETEPVARDNNTILTLKRGDQTLSRLTQLIIVVIVCGVYYLTVLVYTSRRGKYQPLATDTEVNSC